MAKPYSTNIIIQKKSKPEGNFYPISNSKRTIVKEFVRDRKVLCGSSKVVDNRDMRFWKEFDYLPGILIGVMRRWENGNR